jgi:ferredoxin
LNYFPKNFGKIACVGCGRCILYCPVNFDIRQTIEEIQKLRGKEHGWRDLRLDATPTVLREVRGQWFDIEATFEPREAKSIGLDVRGHKVEYSAVAGS